MLSEILASPGPTHSVFDALAAGIALHEAKIARAGLLGFAGGGLVAPLRAMGCAASVASCDLDSSGWQLFQELSADWCGDVTMQEVDAIEWLRASRKRLDVIVEDLSCLGADGEETKPAISVTALPERIHRRLCTEGGVVVTNLLPVPGVSWRAMQRQIANPWPRAVLLELDEWENRLLFAGPGVPTARALGRSIGAKLHEIGSNLAGKFRAREL